MAKIKQINHTNPLVQSVIEGISQLKGEEIVKIDLTKIEDCECEYYIVCHGNSNTHISSIAESVEKTVKEETGESVWHSDGFQNAEWILLDYVNVMVHIFRPEFRKHYDIEQLWADADIKAIEVEN